MFIFFIFLYKFKSWTLTGENKPDLLAACLYCSAVKGPAFPQSRTSCTPAVQWHLPDRNAKFDGGHERFYGKQLCWICSSSFSFFSFHLMNEISHAALLQALAHLGGKALSLSLSLALPLFVSVFNAFKHLIAARQLLTHILATNTPLIETFN